MKGLVGIFGVLVLLLFVNSEASVNSNRNFWKLPWGSYDQAAPASGSEDLTFDNEEGSGVEENDKDSGTGGTHEDDEDYDVGSGDDIIDLTTDDDDDDKDDTNKGDDYDTYDDGDKKEESTTVDDEDLFEGSGSGDGDLAIDEEIVPVDVKPVETGEKPTTTEQPQRPLTGCENLRKASMMTDSVFMPECESDGSYKKLQCMEDNAQRKECWCVDPHGMEVAGTRMTHPKTPDCLYGENLSTCVFQLVQNSHGLLGAYKPRCTDDGEYEPIQCLGSECWCVDSEGNEIVGTFVNKPELPNCPIVTDTNTIDEEVKPDKTVNLPKPDDGYTVTGDGKTKEDIDSVVVNIKPDDSVDKDEELEEERPNINGEPYATYTHQEPILAQPGLLAAIIGGAVVGLLCMVLLVMFIVYRMRKKDEGSYPLDEQKYQNYSYTKAPDKEFYA